MTEAPTAADLTDLFRDFYARLIDVRQHAEDEASDLDLEEMREPLVGFLENLRAADENSADAIALREATYVMAVFADEQFTGFDWRLRGAWESAPLESRMFQTSEAGSAIFRRIEQLLSIGNPGQRPLTRLYLLVLSLGFRGGLEAGSAEGKVGDLRKRLLELAAKERVNGDPSRSLAPNAYQHTADRSVPRLLPNLRLWAWIALTAGLALLVTSPYFRREATEMVAALVERAFSGDSTGMAWALQALVDDHFGKALALLAALIFLACSFTYRVARSARSRSELDHTGALRQGATAEVRDLASRSPHANLRRSFARARVALQHDFRGNRAGYDHPWISVLGPALQGKSTLLEKSSLGIAFAESHQQDALDRPDIHWWAFEGGVVLDVIVADLFRPDDSSKVEAQERTILRNLRRSRPRRPLDGVVLALPATWFLDDTKPLAHRLAEAKRLGVLLQRKLAEAQRVLGIRLPVFLLFSNCELIPGFSPLLRPTLDNTAQNDQQMLGWSNPANPTAPYSRTWPEPAFDLLHEELEEFQLRSLADSADPDLRSREFILLPKRLQDLAAPLGVYTNQLFQPVAGAEPPLFRGVYLCAEAEPSPEADEAVTEAVRPPHPVAQSTIVFVADLFERKIFPEAGLARPTKRAVLRARLWRGVFAAVIIGSLLWGILGRAGGA